MNSYHRVTRLILTVWVSKQCEHSSVYINICVCSAGVEQRWLSLPTSNSTMVLCSRTLQMMAALGAARVAERSHTASKKQDTTARHSI